MLNHHVISKIGPPGIDIRETRDEAKADLLDYIERLYDPCREYSTLGHLSPVALEERGALVPGVHETGYRPIFLLHTRSEACGNSALIAAADGVAAGS